MRVDALMSTDLATVRPETDLRVAVGEMRSHGCGFLPVVEGGGRVVGVLTDRDVALALGADEVRPLERSVADVMTGAPHRCRSDESPHHALRRMRGAPTFVETNPTWSAPPLNPEGSTPAGTHAA